MTDNSATATAPVPTGEDQAPAIPAAVEAVWQGMIAAVPDTEGGDGYSRIFAQLAGATDIADLNAPWETSDLGRFVDLPLTIHSISKSPSTYAGGIPFFLVVGATVEETGEQVTVTTGSTNIVAQLVRAYAAGLFPVRVKVKIADKPTAQGYFPQRLEFLPARAAAKNGGAATK